MSKKVEDLNIQHLKEFYKKHNLILGYKKNKRNRMFPTVEDVENNLTHTCKDFCSRNYNDVFYTSCSYANYLLERKKIIDANTKLQLDELLNKYYYEKICCS